MTCFIWEPINGKLSAACSSIHPQLGGYQLWASVDGKQWTPVLEDGRGNPVDVGIRTILSTPHGLFVGSSNHARLFNIMGRRRRAEFEFPQGFEVLLAR